MEIPDFTSYGPSGAALMTEFLFLGVLLYLTRIGREERKESQESFRELINSNMTVIKDNTKVIEGVNKNLETTTAANIQHEERASARAKEQQKSFKELVSMIQGNHQEQLQETRSVVDVVKQEKQELKEALVSTYIKSFENAKKFKELGGEQ